MIIYYNPECSKCNAILGLLQENNCAFEIREYLKQPPTVDELRELVAKLRVAPFDLVRKTEPHYLNELQNRELSDEQWLQVLSENPVLIERPIVIDGEKAIIGRPPVMVLELLKNDGV